MLSKIQKLGVCHRLDTDLLGNSLICVPYKWPENHGFMAIVGDPAAVPLVRVQSRCCYGEVFGSHHCDCGAQLKEAARLLRSDGGYLFYLEQEGRGAGLSFKARAYAAAEAEEVDSFSYYVKCGLSPDLRRYDCVASCLCEIGISRIRLLTNNPSKEHALRSHGIDVALVPLPVVCHDRAREYMEAKRRYGYLI
jgi:3,4-dihydroxy 2-butanone 4-phosphate synthase/GTP cyclohydrolase II